MGFLEDDLRDSADYLREHRYKSKVELEADYAGADRLEELADAVDELDDPVLLAEYTAALNIERLELSPDGPDTIHCSMTIEIGVGFLRGIDDIAEVCRTYIRAVKQAQRDPDWWDTMTYEFWREFTSAGHA